MLFLQTSSIILSLSAMIGLRWISTQLFQTGQTGQDFSETFGQDSLESVISFKKACSP